MSESSTSLSGPPLHFTTILKHPTFWLAYVNAPRLSITLHYRISPTMNTTQLLLHILVSSWLPMTYKVHGNNPWDLLPLDHNTDTLTFKNCTIPDLTQATKVDTFFFLSIFIWEGWWYTSHWISLANSILYEMQKIGMGEENDFPMSHVDVCHSHKIIYFGATPIATSLLASSKKILHSSPIQHPTQKTSLSFLNSRLQHSGVSSLPCAAYIHIVFPWKWHHRKSETPKPSSPLQGFHITFQCSPLSNSYFY